MFYSGSTGGFYDAAVHGDAMPADVIAITADEHTALLADQSEGKRIVRASSGKPISVTPILNTLEDVRPAQSDVVRAHFDAACNAPVEALGTHWNGGFDSAIKLDAAMRLAQASGATSVTFFDLANESHTINFEHALQVVLAVAGDFQIKLARKQALIAAIANAPTVAEVLAVQW